MKFLIKQSKCFIRLMIDMGTSHETNKSRNKSDSMTILSTLEERSGFPLPSAETNGNGINSRKTMDIIISSSDQHT